MPITIPSGRTIALAAKSGGGFWSQGLAGGSEPLPDAGNYSAILNALYLNLYSDFESWGAGSVNDVTTWYYVDAAAAGGGDGSVGSPYTLAEAKALSLLPGEGLSLNSGTYSWTDVYTITWSGTAGNPIYIKSTDINNKAVISGGGTGQILTQQNSYLGIFGLEITNTDGIGFGQGSLAIDSHHLTVESCHFHDIVGNQGNNIAALRMDRTHQCVFRNNKIVNITAVGGDGSNTDGHAYETYRGYNNLFEHNEVVNTAKGFYVKIPTATAGNGNIVRRNTFKDLRGAVMELGGNDGENQIHEKNIFSENLGIRVGGIADPTSELLLQPSSLYVVNNTLIDAGLGLDGHSGVRIWNNIIDKLAGAAEADLTILLRGGGVNAVSEIVKCDYNCYPQGFSAYDESNNTNYNGLVSWQSADNSGVLNLSPLGPDANSFTTNPSYQDSVSGDYRLSVGSPCIGTGEGGDNIGAYATQDSVIGRIT